MKLCWYVEKENPSTARRHAPPHAASSQAVFHLWSQPGPQGATPPALILTSQRQPHVLISPPYEAVPDAGSAAARFDWAAVRPPWEGGGGSRGG